MSYTSLPPSHILTFFKAEVPIMTVARAIIPPIQLI